MKTDQYLLIGGRLHLDAAHVQSAIQAVSNESLRYAIAQKVMAGTEAGIWDEPVIGQVRWRLSILSPEATSLSVELETLKLPANAELWVYSPSRGDRQGPYTSAHNGPLLTPLVRGEEAIIEARMPASERASFGLSLSTVFHGYLDIRSGPVIAKGYFGNSGACNVNTACSDGDDWRDEIRSTVYLTVDSITKCSGTLVNNSMRNDRALVLTAAHCNISASNVGRTIAYFNTQKTSCTDTADGPVDQNIKGRKLLAKSQGSDKADFSLIELASTPPPAFKVYYAGWDVSGVAPSSGVGIHHPNGDDKKISTYTQAPTQQNSSCIGAISNSGVCNGFKVDVWNISWARGTTEPGSSGSGLWNQNHHLIGTLSGGDSACGIQGRPADVMGSDLYARLTSAWEAPSSTGATLKSLLDAANSGCLSLDGKEPGLADAVNCGGPGPDASDNTSSSGGGSLELSSLLLLGLLIIGRNGVRCAAAQQYVCDSSRKRGMS